MGKSKGRIAPLLEAHFRPTDVQDLVIMQRVFPFRMRADVQRVLEAEMATHAGATHFGGVLQRYSHEGLDLSRLMVADKHDPAVSVPPQYEEMDIGEGDPLRTLDNGLWLLAEGGIRYAVLLAQASQHGCATGLKLQVAATQGADGSRVTQELFRRIEGAVEESPCYRGKILSLEAPAQFGGHAAGLTVHVLPGVQRDEVILPKGTVSLLERNVIGFCAQRERLRELGLPTKKGLLFYGPPGTGKTHTIHYLASALKGHTTFLVSAEQVTLIDEYMALARLLQPSVVVIEDVDLIARERSRMQSPLEEVLLNKLLNEMDGLRPDADILFILTTNRPESLEAALASRPGRVDQAIEFPLPDSEGRAKLVRLYACEMQLSEELTEAAVRRTEGVSASFIKELMRRTAQFLLERGGTGGPSMTDLDRALDELLFSGGSLNRRLLGAVMGAPEGEAGTT